MLQLQWVQEPTCRLSGRSASAALFSVTVAGDDIHGWRTDEARDEQVLRALVKLQRRRANLPMSPAGKHDDPVANVMAST